MICYHGTNIEAARSILENGFNPDSWFAVRLEDAIAFGGLYIFEVDFENVPRDWWQFHVPDAIPVGRIVRYYHKEKTMKQIQGMPDIWDDQIFLTSRDEILGVLACWAVKQSPYIMPDNLEDGLLEFWVQFNACPAFINKYFETNCSTLLRAIEITFEKCPTIRGWNVAKKGSGIVAHSRYHTPEPDYDFIDLSALARNIAQSITLEAKYQKLHD